MRARERDIPSMWRLKGDIYALWIALHGGHVSQRGRDGGCGYRVSCDRYTRYGDKPRWCECGVPEMMRAGVGMRMLTTSS
jgi:hypothetical protein